MSRNHVDIARRPRRNAAFLVLWNTGLQIGARGVAAVIGVVQVGVLSHALGSRRFGEYGFVLAVIGLSGMLADLGLSQVAVRALSVNDVAQRSNTLASVVAARMYLAVAALVASDMFAAVAPIDATERTGIVLMSVAYLLTVPAAISSIFQAELELQFPLAIAIGQSALTLVLTVVLVLVHTSVLGVLAVLVITQTLGAAALGAVAIRRYHLVVRLRVRQGITLLREALPVGIGQVLVVLYFRIDTVLLGLVRGPIDVAHYSAAYKFVDLGSFGGVAFMSAVYPLMVRRGRESEHTRLIAAYQRSFDILMLAAIPLVIILFFLARPIIFLVFPRDFGASVDALRVLSFTLLPLFVNNVLGAIVLSVHRERTFLWVSLGAMILNVSLNVAFIPSFGIMAAAYSTVATELFVTTVAIVLMWRVLHFIPSLRTAGLGLLGAACMAIPMYLLRDRWIVALLLGGVVYLAVTRVVRVWSIADVRGIWSLRGETDGA